MSAICEAGPAHAAALSAMHERVFPKAPWNEAAFAALLRQPGVAALIHDANGFMLLRTVLDEAEILTIGVLEKRRGTGAALLREGLRRLRDAGVQVVHLEVATDNAAARALYEAHGFVKSGLRKAYYENGGDALMLRLDLSSPVAQRS
ncbi:MAG: GNAT family N-acetyltransferase [Proteobacteria bacterium]|nr:GNAT family N-acetyltransferase [Pseudomonadota bacterium]MBU6425839.1 GNAT family N-acetyltransferase [Rhodospirillales bacterium]